MAAQAETTPVTEATVTSALPHVEQTPAQATATEVQVHHVTEVPGVPEIVEETRSDVFSLQGTMILLTWLAFAIAAFVLKKLLWKPVMTFVETREADIKHTLDKMEDSQKQIAATDRKTHELIAQAKNTADSAAADIMKTAKEQAANLVAASQEQQKVREQQAQERLEQEKASTLQRIQEQAGGEVCAALERLLPELLTTEQKQAYQDRILADLQFATK